MCVMAQLSGKCHISVSISTKNRDFVKSLEQYEDEKSLNIFLSYGCCLRLLDQNE